ncbi:MAG TPA: DUF58 domain-containing protein [Candidatus Caenarcaniphilales bacterium]|nr:DUF58 domain-containing protein [Candidatus Caenarcaniphilales bacterium]
MLRRIQFMLLGVALLIAAFSTGAEFLFFLLYLGIVVVGGSYVVTRFGLADLEAGYVLDRAHAEVGDTLRATYTVRNVSRLPKLWLEVHNPSNLPVPLPGRALALGPRAERSWVARVPLQRRGHYRVEQVVIRTGDPFGFFESYASVGRASSVIVYPRVESLPGWALPPAQIEGSHAQSVRTAQTTPHVTSIRPYVPGDAYNRIHWKSSARQGELQVKEFDLEQTADVWIFLDLEAQSHTGNGDESTLEYAVRAAASIGSRSLIENRALGMTAVGARAVVLPPDRGPRQQQKMMQLLAAVQADGERQFRDVLVESIPRLRRGMTAVVITSSTDRDWIRPLTALRSRGVTTAVVMPDAAAFRAHERLVRGLPAASDSEQEAEQRTTRALHHALAEHDIPASRLVPGVVLSEQLVSRSTQPAAVRP